MITRPKKQEKQEENEGLFTREPTPEVDNISVIGSEPTESRKRKATEELDEPKRKNANQGNRESRKSRSRSKEYRKYETREYEPRNCELKEYESRRYQNPEYEHDTLTATLTISITLPAIMEQLIQLQTENGRDCKLVYQQLRTTARILAETSYKKISNL